jgi:hypothetical protein
MEGALAVTRVTPCAAGKRTNVSACPELSVVAVAADSCAPGDAWNTTGAPTTGVPEESSSAILSDSGSNAPGEPVWLSPCTLAMAIRLFVRSKPLMASVPLAADVPPVSAAWTLTVPLFDASGMNISQL